jgi:hypothetical protein
MVMHAGNDVRLFEAYESIKIHSTDQKHSFMGWDDGINHLRIATGLLGLHEVEF